MNSAQWIRSLIAPGKRVAIPIMTHPGIEFLGRSVLDAVTNGEVHFEAIMALHRRFPLAAAATVIMDLTVEAEAFGAEIHFSLDEVPSVLGRMVTDYDEVSELKVPSVDAARVPEYIKANRLAAANIGKPVLGGCIGPYSLAGRLFGMTEMMMAMYTEPDTVVLLLDKCTEFITKYSLAIKQAGVAGVIIAEPAAGLISNEDCQTYSSDYIKKMVDALQDDDFSVILHNCGNTGHCSEAMVSVGARGYHFGNKIDMLDALDHTPSDALVMGNLDPVGIFQMETPEGVVRATRELFDTARGYDNFVISSGCDTPPRVPVQNIEAFYNTVAEQSRDYSWRAPSTIFIISP